VTQRDPTRPWIRTQEAAVLMEPLLAWLTATQRLRVQGNIFIEFPWAGRRVDLVTVGKRLTTSAFELKLGRIGRVLEQAIYNRAAFDRSYIVIAHVPGEQALMEAKQCGVGVLIVQSGAVRLMLDSPLARPGRVVRGRLLRSLGTRSPLESAI